MPNEAEQLALWKQVTSPTCRPLLEAARTCDVSTAAGLQQLRRSWDAPLVRIAIELTDARRRAEKKFPDRPELIADRAGIEQATSALVANHKAQRFHSCLAPHFRGRGVDLCCGIGGDAMALTEVTDVIGVDHSPLQTWMTEVNAGCVTRTVDVETLQLQGEVVHLDPARRDHAGRRHRLEDYTPGPAFIADLLTRCPDAAVKLGPGVDLDAVEQLAPGPCEIEIINEHGTLVQAVLWHGRLAHSPAQRTATRLPGGMSFTAVAGVMPAARTAPGRFLVVPDPALERADLTGPLCAGTELGELHPGLGLLTGNEVIQAPWFSSYQIIAHMPWREARIRQWLAANDGGEVIVRTRGKAIDPDTVHRALRGRGSTPYTIFGLRLGTKKCAFITTPVVDV